MPLSNVSDKMWSKKDAQDLELVLYPDVQRRLVQLKSQQKHIVGQNLA
jgi:hypothetical protein